MSFLESEEFSSSMPESSGPLDIKGQQDSGPFYLRHGTHTRVVKGEVGDKICKMRSSHFSP